MNRMECGTNKYIGQLEYGCSNLTKIFNSRFENTDALNTCWENFAALVIILGWNLD